MLGKRSETDNRSGLPPVSFLYVSDGSPCIYGRAELCARGKELSGSADEGVRALK